MRNYIIPLSVCLSLFLFFASADYSNPKPITLSVESKKVKSGTETCLEVSVKDFSKIVSLQHSINWDPNILKFSKLQKFELPGLQDWSFGKIFTEKGILTFSWYDPAVKGITIPDKTDIYEICFDVIGNKGTNSVVKISGEPVRIETVNASHNAVRLISEKGLVKVTR